ncbi:MAG: 4Fe-4S dicluster domain-containing protein, partial [Dehalococcoidia bacterium]|nr:4Fe-4S dicluster domain-containing protein [Dehalococcoidia bacterium]
MAEASRELFWNIPLGPWIVYPLSAIAVAVFIWASYRRYRLIAIGKRGVPMGSWGHRIANFIGVTIVDIFLHKRLFRDPYPGLMHFFIFWGCLVFLIATAAETINKYVFHYLYGPTYLFLSAYVDIVGLLALVGIAIAAWRRYIQRPKRLDNKPEDAIALILIAVIVITGYLVEGLRFASPDPGKDAAYAHWSTVGWVTSLLISSVGISPPLAAYLHQWTWGLHVILSVGAVIYVSVTFSRFTHILMSPINIFLRPFKPRGRLDSFDIEKAIERGEPLGANQIHHFNWKHLLDTDGCTRCGRCQDECPANFTGKPLSPKKIVQDLRTELNVNGPKVRAAMDKAARLAKAVKPSPSENQAPAQAAPPEPVTAPTIIGSRITEDEIWSCTTCAACLEACPAFIDPLGKIVEMRRNLVLEQTKMPETAQTILKCIEDRGHSCRGTLYTRTDWYTGLDIRPLAEDKNVDILYWTGCAASLEDRNIKVAKAFAAVTKAAGVKIGVLGAEESCCGDPARRMGNEYLFQMLVMK